MKSVVWQEPVEYTDDDLSSPWPCIATHAPDSIGADSMPCCSEAASQRFLIPISILELLISTPIRSAGTQAEGP